MLSSRISKYPSFPILVFINFNLIAVNNAVQTLHHCGMIKCIHSVSLCMYYFPFHDDTGSTQHGTELYIIPAKSVFLVAAKPTRPRGMRHAYWLAKKKDGCVLLRLCSNHFRDHPSLGFYRLPMEDAERKRKWILAIRRKPWEPSKHTRICGDQFVSGQFILLCF